MSKKLPYNEYHILTAVYNSSENRLSLDEVIEKTGIHQTFVSATSDKLEEEGLFRIDKKTVKIFRLGREGEQLQNTGFPEIKVRDYLIEKNEDSIELPDIPDKTGIEKRDIGDVIKLGGIKGWFKKEGRSIILTDKGKNSAGGFGEDEKLIKILAEKGRLTENNLKKEISLDEAMRLLKSRSNAVKYKEKVLKVLSLTEKGRDLIASGIETVEEINQLTQEMLQDGSWRNFIFRKYNVNDVLGKEYPGKMHPLQKVLEDTRKAFLEMGFEESFSPYVESAFWDFDALFQPQDHPAREMQDTFYMKNPKTAKLPDDNTVDIIRQTHENGWETGSTGWGYKWDVKKAMQTILRTHNTANSIRCLAKHPKPPYKVFEVGPVFRREKMDQKHLAVFHQVDGIIVDENASFSSLLGTLTEFYKKMGFKTVKYKPDFFPYTEPSVSAMAKMEKTDSWIEVGGAGVFRPEVTEPFGCRVPVLAWGLGLERIAMVRYNINDIRKFYWNDVQWLRDVPLSL